MENNTETTSNQKKIFTVKKKPIYLGLSIAVIILLTTFTASILRINNQNAPLQTGKEQTRATQPPPFPSPFLSPTPTLVPGKEYTVGRTSVKFKEGIPRQLIEEKLKHYDAKIIEQIEQINVTILQVPQGQEQEIADKLTNDGLVEYAELDFIYETFSVPNDPEFSKQYGLTKIQAPQAWDITKGAGVKIAIIDEGFDHDHPDLAAKIISSKGTGSSEHGTHTAGIAAAATNNSRGIAGTCPDCQLLIVRGIQSTVNQNIIWAADQGAKVINMSWGGRNNSKTLQDTLNYAWEKGAVLIASAGNSSNSTKYYPAASDNVIAVASSTGSDTKSPFSSYGTWVDIAAPGSGIYSTLPNNKYGNKSGTSMSAPMIAGVAGLIWATPNVTSPQAVVDRLCATADKIQGTGQYWTCGRVNAFKAVQGSSGSGTATPPATGSACHTQTNLSSIPENYAAPYNVHSAQKELLLQAACSQNSTQITVGNGNSSLLIYKNGYRHPGTQWTPLTLTCQGQSVSDGKGSTWCLGKATAAMPQTDKWFAAYTCQQISGLWKCGCRDSACSTTANPPSGGLWQLQGIKK
jgi:thermitase